MPRSYSEDDKASALAALDLHDGNLTRASRASGVPISTLRDWSRGEHVNGSVAEKRHHKKGELADRLEGIARELADAISDKIGDATLQQTATSLGIVVDKMQLLRGEATVINEDRTDARDKLASLVNRYARRASEGRDSGEPVERASGGDSV